MLTEVHDTAVVHPGAEIGENVSIGPYAVIGEHVKIGDNCRLGSHVLIDGYTTIGNNNKMFHGASIGTAPQDLKYDGAVSYVEIGDDKRGRHLEDRVIHPALACARVGWDPQIELTAIGPGDFYGVGVGPAPMAR